jgi:DNA-binding response OmpR family regulator
MNDTKTILVVEDERPLLEAIKLKLEDSGLEAVLPRELSLRLCPTRREFSE